MQAYDALVDLSERTGQSPETQSLLDLYRLFKGPIATTPDNRREAFLPVKPETPTRNIYPPDATRNEIEAFMLSHPDERELLMSEHTVVRRANAESLQRDLDILTKYPTLDVLHPNLRRRLEALRTTNDATQFYALPQSVRWAQEMMRVYQRLNNAARFVRSNDPEFARYLRNRARDLLSDDYESGDASWVTGNFKHLNAQIGSYETYDDALFGAKTFMSMSLLKRDESASKLVRETIGNLQEIEDALPAPVHRVVREDINIGVYDVIADFGQARGGNTASSLPNDPLFSKRYGQIILLRGNIMRNPDLFANTQAAWKALMTSPFDNDLTEDGELSRTLWHEIGHYLSVDRDRRGRSIDAAFQSSSDTFKELKADLVALFAVDHLHRKGAYSDQELIAAYASGINRMFVDSKPRREQAYQTMELMQFNWFHEHGVFDIEAANNNIIIHYDRYPAAVNEMLEAVLKMLYEGDRSAADAFIDRWTQWNDEVHEVVAKIIRDNHQFQYALFKYGVLGE
ncbi:MAG TPA: hypothetical protein VET48_10065 [Steroidobacteraceae bacterium]|nr:hypothetical protein [Steroidobacteraceae bacterium]